MYSAAKLKKMFHDLLDQPRRETEALRAQCAAQETRIKQLESVVDMLKLINNLRQHDLHNWKYWKNSSKKESLCKF